MNKYTNEVIDVIDIDYYRSSYPDLEKLDAETLKKHYLLYGISEGRISHPLALRENFISNLPKQGRILEIGPFCNPLIRGDNVAYFDVLNKEDLIARAKEINYPFQEAPDIDFISPIGDLSIVTETFDAIVSSHSIEHQPDLVRHLQQISDCLNKGGQYYIIVPDKRYCFDHTNVESTIADVLDAHHEKRLVHTLGSVIRHKALTTHNNAVRHWKGDHVDAGYNGSIARRTQQAIAEFSAADGRYIDVHAWQLTPSGLYAILRILHSLGLNSLVPTQIFHTPRNRLEFTAILTKSEAST